MRISYGYQAAIVVDGDSEWMYTVHDTAADALSEGIERLRNVPRGEVWIDKYVYQDDREDSVDCLPLYASQGRSAWARRRA